MASRAGERIEAAARALAPYLPDAGASNYEQWILWSSGVCAAKRLRSALASQEAADPSPPGGAEAVVRGIPEHLDTLLHKWADARDVALYTEDERAGEAEDGAYNALLAGLLKWAHPTPAPRVAAPERAVIGPEDSAFLDAAIDLWLAKERVQELDAEAGALQRDRDELAESMRRFMRAGNVARIADSRPAAPAHPTPAPLAAPDRAVVEALKGAITQRVTDMADLWEIPGAEQPIAQDLCAVVDEVLSAPRPVAPAAPDAAHGGGA